MGLGGPNGSSGKVVFLPNEKFLQSLGAVLDQHPMRLSGFQYLGSCRARDLNQKKGGVGSAISVLHNHLLGDNQNADIESC